MCFHFGLGGHGASWPASGHPWNFIAIAGRCPILNPIGWWSTPYQSFIGALAEGAFSFLSGAFPQYSNFSPFFPSFFLGAGVPESGGRTQEVQLVTCPCLSRHMHCVVYAVSWSWRYGYFILAFYHSLAGTPSSLSAVFYRFQPVLQVESIFPNRSPLLETP